MAFESKSCWLLMLKSFQYLIMITRKCNIIPKYKPSRYLGRYN